MVIKVTNGYYLLLGVMQGLKNHNRILLIVVTLLYNNPLTVPSAEKHGLKQIVARPGNKRNTFDFSSWKLLWTHLPSWFGIEQSWILCDVVVLVSGHFRQSVISFKNGQSFAKELQCLGLEKLAEKQKREAK